MISSDDVKRREFVNNWIMQKSYLADSRNPPVGQVVLNAPQDVREKLKSLTADDLNYLRSDVMFGRMLLFTEHAR